jgi:hypothetical protein
MKENIATHAFSKSGTLTVKITGDKEITVQLVDKDGPVSEPWKKVLEYVQRLAQ